MNCERCEKELGTYTCKTRRKFFYCYEETMNPPKQDRNSPFRQRNQTDGIDLYRSCKTCCQTLPISEFYREDSSECKVCRQVYDVQRKKDDPEYREHKNRIGRENFRKLNENPAHRAKYTEHVRKFRDKNRDRINAQARIKRQSIPKLEKWLKQCIAKYHISREEVKSLYDKAGGLCMLCGRPFNEDVKIWKMCLDHDHKTGKVRGLIHSKCNHAIGFFEDDPKIIKLALAYLEKNSHKDNPC